MTATQKHGFLTILAALAAGILSFGAFPAPDAAAGPEPSGKARKAKGTEAGKWTTHHRKGLLIKSAAGSCRISYSVSVPPGFKFYTYRVGAMVLVKGRKDVAFAVQPIHKGDAGPEQLLNEKDGLRKWVGRVQKGLKLVGTHRLKINGGWRRVLELRTRNQGVDFFFYVAMVKVKDANVVLKAGGPLAEQEKYRKHFWRMLEKFSARPG